MKADAIPNDREPTGSLTAENKETDSAKITEDKMTTKKRSLNIGVGVNF